ncbi:MAG: hypothetical protein KY467_03515 [Gemmatimonadetes bacterium]|nr:hypothetical protein [Gemmatimonadota bacterium]
MKKVSGASHTAGVEPVIQEKVRSMARAGLERHMRESGVTDAPARGGLAGA